MLYFLLLRNNVKKEENWILQEIVKRVYILKSTVKSTTPEEEENVTGQQSISAEQHTHIG